MIDPLGPLISTGQGSYRKDFSPGPIDLRFWLITLPAWLVVVYGLNQLGHLIGRIMP